VRRIAARAVAEHRSPDTFEQLLLLQHHILYSQGFADLAQFSEALAFERIYILHKIY